METKTAPTAIHTKYATVHASGIRLPGVLITAMTAEETQAAYRDTTRRYGLWARSGAIGLDAAWNEFLGVDGLEIVHYSALNIGVQPIGGCGCLFLSGDPLTCRDCGTGPWSLDSGSWSL